ncbi:MAG: helix-turn-helix domain-containing protein [Cyclobacteriaceae bacterium]
MHDWNQIFIGVQLYIIFQITLVGLFNVFEKNPKNIFLGAYSLLVCHSPLMLLFPDYLKSNVILHVLVWAWKGFFFGPLLYLYLMALNKRGDVRKELMHLVVPMALFGMVLYGEFFTTSGSSERFVINNIKYYSYWLLILIYFKLGLKEFKQQIRIELKEESKVRFFGFYLIVNIHLLSTILPGLILVLSKQSDITFVDDLSQSIALPYYRYFAVPIYLLLFLFLTFYGITELQWIKRYFLKTSIHLSNTSKGLHVGPVLKDYFEVHEIYKNPNLTIDELSILTRLTKSTIRNYLAENNYESFTDYVNHYRVDDLKKNLLSGKYENFDFASIALVSGFNSKATFYRIFKKYTGKTPSEYKSEFQENSNQ